MTLNIRTSSIKPRKLRDIDFGSEVRLIRAVIGLRLRVRVASTPTVYFKLLSPRYLSKGHHTACRQTSFDHHALMPYTTEDYNLPVAAERLDFC